MTIIMYDVKHRTEIDIKVSRGQVTANRKTILDAAGHLFRAQGFEKITVADVMKAAGLTHGGFYGYFKSKDDLAAEISRSEDNGEASGKTYPYHWRQAR